jgi:hypothetical protein
VCGGLRLVMPQRDRESGQAEQHEQQDREVDRRHGSGASRSHEQQPAWALLEQRRDEEAAHDARPIT